MAESRNTDKPTADVDRLTEPREQRPSQRCQLSVCGVAGVFTRKDRGWVLENESELSVLAGLGADREGISQFRAIVPALNAGVVGPGDLRDLSQYLQALAEAEEVCWVYVPEHLVAAVTVACAHWDHKAAEQWLCWALAERLEENLSGPVGAVAGWLSWNSLYEGRRVEAWWRGSGWMEKLDGNFWDRLATHENSLVRAANIASDPKTTPSQLKSLAASGDKEILDLVASHPKAPARVLMDLADLEAGRPVKLMWRAAQSLSAPKRVLERLASKALTHNMHSFDHTPQKDGKLTEMTVALCLIAQNPNTPPRTLTRLARCEHASPLICVARNPNTPHQTLEQLSSSQEWAVRQAVATNKAAPKSLLARLASDSRREVRAEAAANPMLTGRLLGELAHDRSFLVRKAVAAKPSLPRKLLETLAGDPDGRVRWEIAYNSETPSEILTGFVVDLDPLVRRITAWNDSTPADAVARLAEDTDHGVLRTVSSNPKTPPAALMRFAQCEDKNHRSDVASNPSTPQATLELLAQDPDFRIQYALAANPSTPQSVLVRLPQTKYSPVRASVAENPATPIWLVEQLLEDDCFEVYTTAADSLAKRTNGAAAAD